MRRDRLKYNSIVEKGLDSVLCSQCKPSHSWSLWQCLWRKLTAFNDEHRLVHVPMKLIPAYCYNTSMTDEKVVALVLDFGNQILWRRRSPFQLSKAATRRLQGLPTNPYLRLICLVWALAGFVLMLPCRPVYHSFRNELLLPLLWNWRR
ncbi:uncharacterized protein BO88DRAFT_77975 [Aspergillus vadensis CBS 113365]|uniref:Uncharacterized protein n=1 Tax=Aspergillus vadensis (strain CBS 113365 / IMI 142717 / IBT 24658) TaxID=1448311 RepID=A0A319B615_ASPVC|nr:hypothetical protein BO88DRAFT_77975 [Aspergillus vadensis CBS 113365]PYH67769.1 hypothetical protein BO88DRAFT_77975 [Aspergillus vadensis CBS 113365]